MLTTGPSRTWQIGRASCRERVWVAGGGGSSRRRHTRCLSDWSSDVCSSDLVAALRSALPSRLRSGPLVLKRARGNGGLGVWKVELTGPGELPGLTSAVRVEHAHDGAVEDVADRKSVV